MAVETQERAENEAETTQWATKADVETVSDRVEELSGAVEKLSERFEALVLEVVKLQVGQKWIAWILGAMCAALMAIFGTLVVIALQL